MDVTDCIPLVYAEVRRIGRKLPRYVPRDELLAAGLLGLVEAGKRYRPGGSAKFSSYATHRVRGAILDAVHAETKTRKDRPTRLRRLSQNDAEVVFSRACYTDSVSRDLCDLLDCLTDEERTVVNLRLVDEMRFSEIRAAVGLGTRGGRFYGRILDKLRDKV